MFSFTDAELSAYLDEDLPQERMALIEQALRDNANLAQKLTQLIGSRDAGVHTVGAMWRRGRLSCPSREQLGSLLLEVLDAAHAEYVRFHLETIGCRVCNASLDDLRQQHTAHEHAMQATRRKRYFESSAGYLSSDR
jgi:hypothetical protein